jgi:spore germination protein YaaH
MGFFLPSQIDDVLANADLHALTSLVYFGISSNKKGGLHTTDHGGPDDYRWSAWNGARMTKLIGEAHAVGTKVILSVTRFSWNAAGMATTEKLLSSREARQRLARQTADAVVQRGVDGVNVDFEPIPSSQRETFVDFVRRLRSALDAREPGLELTVDSTGYISNYDVAGLTAPGAADAIYIMAYHYTGSWSRRAGAVSPLVRSTYDVTDTVNAFLQYTTPNKLMLGLAWYGNVWPTKSDSPNARVLPAGSRYGSPGSVTYANAAAIASAHGRQWDDEAKVPWTRWQARACSSCPVTWFELYYEDAQSQAAKHQLVIQKKLRGTGIWTLGFAASAPELYGELRATFGTH